MDKRKRKFLLIITSVFFFVLPASASIASQPQVVPHQVVVSFSKNATPQEKSAVLRKTSTQIASKIKIESPNSVVINVNKNYHRINSQLRRNSSVKFVEPNYLVHAARIPNDSLFAEQWGLYNLGQNGGQANSGIDAPDAWNVTTQSLTVVAVVDTGIDYNHPDLATNIWVNSSDPVNGVDDDHDGYVDDSRGWNFLASNPNSDDDAGHGTHVAGIIGGVGNNNIGITGVSWSVKLMALKFLDANGEGNTADAANAIDYAVSHGAKIINTSWGGSSYSQTLYDAVQRANDKGILVVAAAGNEGINTDSAPDYPADFDLPNIISVAAADRYDKLSLFSNYGKTSVDLAAPGEEILSTVPAFVSPSGYESYSGTSMATPFVSGAAALYLGKFPVSGAPQIKAAIINSVDRKPAFSQTLSQGRLNVSKALGIQPEPRKAKRDKKAPQRFNLLSPRNKFTTHKQRILFRWQQAFDNGGNPYNVDGIKYYRFYLNGHIRATIRDPDSLRAHGEARPRIKLRIRPGHYIWSVKAFDYTGNHRSGSTNKKQFKRSFVVKPTK